MLQRHAPWLRSIGVLALALLSACGVDPVVPVVVEQPVRPPPAADTDPPLVAPPVAERVVDLEKAREDQVAWRAEMDRYGRGLLESFRLRVYDPSRDAGLRFAEVVANVRSGDASGRFHVTFDASKPLDDRVAVTPGDGADSLPAGSLEQVRRFAHVGLAGAYRSVVHYFPPAQVLTTKSKDGLHRVVTCPPHQHDVSVSYSIDDQDLVTIRGTSVIPNAEIAYYAWTFSKGRYFLSKQWMHGSDAVVDYEMDDRDTDGVVLVRRASVQRAEKSFVVTFEFERLDVDR